MIKLLFTFSTFLFFQMSLFAQFSEPIYVVADIGVINELITADLNNDGIKDIIATGERGLGWYDTSDPNPELGKIKPIIVDAGMSFNTAITGDVNNDGFNDIVVTSLNGSAVVYLQNNGDDTFTEKDRISFSSPLSLDLGFINNDDVLDLVISTGQSTGLVNWYAGFSSGNGFGGANNILSGGHPKNAVRILDFDGDGDGDILHNTIVGLTRYMNNQGNGVFEQFDFTIVSNTQDGLTAAYRHEAMIYNDLDGDGDLDICLASDDDNGHIYWAEQTALGVYNGFVSIIPDSHFGPYIKLRFVDMNNDGIEDILASKEGNVLVWYPRISGVSFGAEQIISNQSQDFATIASDTDPDKQEFIATFQEYLLLYPREDNGVFSDPINISSRHAITADVILVDINDDQLKDVVFCSETFDHIGVYHGLGNKKYGEPVLLSEGISNLQDVVSADLNGDGSPDLVFTTIDEGVGWLQNTGDGTFLPIQYLDNSSSDDHINVGDIDEDGDVDIIGGGALIRFNDGLGNFTAHPFDYNYVGNGGPLTVLDYDNDGDLDLMGYHYFDNMWLENDGNENFTTHLMPTYEFVNMAGRAFVDVDNDGLVDILYPYRVEDKISYHRRDEGVTYFPEADLFLNIDNARTPVGDDFDFDGDTDIVAFSYADEELYFYSGEGNGDFSERTVIFQTSGDAKYNTVAKDDMDGDGDMDLLLYPLQISSSIILFENEEVDNSQNTLRGFVYYDENENGIRDADEQGIRNFQITDDNNNTFSYTDNNGRYQMRGGAGTYHAAPVLSSCWTLTSDPDEYTINYQENEGNTTEDLNFGLIPTGTSSAVEVTLTAAGITRCNNDVPFYLQVSNTGCVPLTGTFGFLPDPSVAVAISIPAPDFTQDDTLFWNYSDLFANNTESVYIEMSIPGVEQLGQIIEMPAVTYASGINGTNISDTLVHISEILCAYDPNDKNVSPRRELSDFYNENYTLFSEELAYTVRFQNTGNDTAFTVRIRDVLDTNLDLTTFRTGTASHNYYTELDGETGTVDFIFEDILLPDSTTNLQGSQGFVNFFISSQQDLPEFTEIDNTASIYFDFNPPIITNTIKNILVSELPQSPIAQFSYNIEDYEVSFTSETLNDPTDISWDFDNDMTSLIATPVITFTPGIYNVCLTAENAFGINTYCEEITIEAQVPTANFAYTTDYWQVDFIDVSSEFPSSWQWNFGDGNTSTLQNPTHIYMEDGTYNSCLEVQNEAGLDEFCTEITVAAQQAPIADFSFTINDFTVNFSNNSTTDLIALQWTFGDGNMSNTFETSHTYTENGVYTVCLEIENAVGLDELCMEVLIDVAQAPTANFDFITDDFTVDFENLSTGEISGLSWNFGDSNTSDLENPEHIYAENGVYNVCLEAENEVGSDEYCLDVLIDVLQAPVADFDFVAENLTVVFNNTSVGEISELSWTFGEGTTSNLVNPEHNYEEGGQYEVCLSVENAAGSDEKCDLVSIMLSDLSNSIQNSLKIFPNPAIDILLVSLTNEKITSMEVFDITGRLVFDRNIVNGTSKLSINVENWLVGTYQVRVTTEKGYVLTQAITIAR